MRKIVQYICFQFRWRQKRAKNHLDNFHYSKTFFDSICDLSVKSDSKLNFLSYIDFITN